MRRKNRRKRRKEEKEEEEEFAVWEEGERRTLLVWEKEEEAEEEFAGLGWGRKRKGEEEEEEEEKEEELAGLGEGIGTGWRRICWSGSGSGSSRPLAVSGQLLYSLLLYLQPIRLVNINGRGRGGRAGQINVRLVTASHMVSLVWTSALARQSSQPLNTTLM